MGDWAELPSDLLTLIVERIDMYEDFVGFGGVCRSWRCIAVKENFNDSPQIPWLMLREGEEKGGGFVSLTKGGMIHRVELPGARGWRGCFSSMGWLITINAADDMELLHPLNRVCIPLPHPRTIKYYYPFNKLLHRAVLSASPSVTEDYVLMVIFRGVCVGFWKPGKNIWTVIDGTEQHPYSIHDVVYYKDQFYAIDCKGQLLLCNMNSCTSKMVGRIHQGIAQENEVYLVECGGELLVVSGTALIRHYSDGYVKSGLCFGVFKFDSTDFYNFQPIDDFGGRSIFVAYGSSASAVTACAAGTKSNCIYYAAEGYVNPFYTLYRRDYFDTVMYKWGCHTGLRVSKGMEFRKEKQHPIWVSPSF